MGAARFVGRVGGLAVALGVGCAAFLGQGVAWADEGSPGSPGQDNSSQAGDTGKAGASGTDSEVTAAASRSAQTSGSIAGTSTPAERLARLGTVFSNGGALTSKRSERLGIAGRLQSKLADKATEVAETLKEATPKAESAPASSSSFSALAPETAPPDSTLAANTFVDKARDWLASPRAVAGRAAPELPAAVSSLPPTLIRPTETVAAQTPAPATGRIAPTGVSNLLTSVVDDVLRPFAGNAPQREPADSPASWIMMAAARREIGIGSTTSNLVSVPTLSTSLLGTPSLSYTPTLAVTNGVIGGIETPAGGQPPVSSRGYPLVYTVVSDPSVGGKIALDSTTGNFTYLPYATIVRNGSENVGVMVSETAPLIAVLEQVPLAGGFVQPIVIQLHQVPILGDALSPVIGSATVATVNLDPSQINTTGNPIAYTYKVTSFDGTLISSNFFPASGVTTGYEDPTILYGPGVATAGATDPTDPVLSAVRNDGYNVVTWDPRGEFDSGGVLQVDNPQFEGRDVSAIISWVAGQNGVQLDAPDDPRLGMVGESYGGAIQLVTAANDHRIDAIVPRIAWNSLPGSLYPSEAFRTSYGALLLLGLVLTGARINDQLYGGILTGALLGVLTDSQQALLASSGPSITVTNITAPTLLLQGTVDVLFPLQQAIDNAEILTAATSTHTPVPTNMIWFCGGHGVCLTNPGDPALVQTDSLAWLDAYVKHKGEGVVPDIPKFQWVDQNGVYHSSGKLPFEEGFIAGSVDASKQFSGASGLLPIIPILGGSGPQSQDDSPFPYPLRDAAPATNAVNVDIPAPNGTTYAVGAPTVTMTYSGIGTSRHLYGQIVDKKTGLVVGNLVTPIPVTLDGAQHTAQVPLSDIAYTMDSSSDLELQIVSSATPFLNLTQWGYVNISDVSVSLPTADPAQVDPVRDDATAGQLVNA